MDYLIGTLMLFASIFALGLTTYVLIVMTFAFLSIGVGGATMIWDGIKTWWRERHETR